MCGVAGQAAARPDVALDPSVLASLRHRGPDSEGIKSWTNTASSWSIAHTRLAIVDLSAAGNQPMASEDGSLVMVFNGEIYNHAELRRLCTSAGHRMASLSDGEVIVHLWEMEGPDCLRRLNGIFAIAIASTTTGEVWLARDPVGVKPLYYTRENDQLWFASELRSLGATGAPLRSLDQTALAQFLTFLWIPDPRTPFKGVRSLRAGEFLHWDPRARSCQVDRYIDLVTEDHDLVAPTVGAASAMITQAVQRQLLADVPLGLMASGGVDSSLVWNAAADTIDRAYTIDWSDDGRGERLHEDTAAVRELEKHFGTNVAYVDGTAVDVGNLPLAGDLFADPAFDLTRAIARAASEHGHKVLLSGQGGDELFGGYRRHLVTRLLGRPTITGAARMIAALAQRMPAGRVRTEYLARLARAVSRKSALEGYMELCTYSTAADRARALDCDEAEVADTTVWQEHQAAFDRLPVSWSNLRKLRAVDFSVYLPGLGLAYADRGGMEFGVEVRVPWLDIELVRWALALPDDALVQGRQTKRLARQVAAGTLPGPIAHRPKRGFGVPSEQVNVGVHGGEGTRGFRQSAYFDQARHVLTSWRSGFGRR